MLEKVRRNTGGLSNPVQAHPEYREIGRETGFERESLGQLVPWLNLCNFLFHRAFNGIYAVHLFGCVYFLACQYHYVNGDDRLLDDPITLIFLSVRSITRLWHTRQFHREPIFS